MSVVGHLWRRHRTLFLSFLVVALLALFFAVRAGVQFAYWSDPAHRDQTLAGWMTPRYVSHSWDVPPEVVSDALGLDRDGGGRRVTLDEIAAERGVPLPALTAALAEAIASHRSAR